MRSSKNEAKISEIFMAFSVISGSKLASGKRERSDAHSKGLNVASLKSGRKAGADFDV